MRRGLVERSETKTDYTSRITINFPAYGSNIMENTKFIYSFQEYIIVENSTISLSLKGRPPLPSASGVSGKGDDISLYESIID